MSSTRSTRIAVTIEGREDRGILVYSDDLPGLILSGPDAEAVLAGIEAAVTYLFADRAERWSAS